MLYVGETRHANLWRLDLGASDPIPTTFTRGTARFNFPAISSGGQWVFASEGPETRMQIVKFPIQGGDGVPVTAGANASLSPDRKRLAYVIGEPGKGVRVWTSDADGRGATELADATTNGVVGPSWLPDGRLAWRRDPL